jgi:tetratricopeptide (TPR) repeat protein
MKEFETTDFAKAKLKRCDAQLGKLQGDLDKAATHTLVGQSFLDDDKKPDPSKALTAFKEARLLDPANLNLLSRTANASFTLTRPTMQSSKSRVVGNEKAAAEALELYALWLERTPGNVKVMLCLGKLHHLKGETDKARKFYDQVIALNLDVAVTKEARTLRKAADDNPRNEG